MWRLLCEEEKGKLSILASKKNPAFQMLSIVAYGVVFLLSLAFSFLDIIPGEGDLSPWPADNILLERFVQVFPFCIGITIMTFVVIFLRFSFMKKNKRINYEYSKMFSSSRRLCLKCNKTFDAGVCICPACNYETKDINNYIWED
jgi:hypothetical protein